MARFSVTQVPEAIQPLWTGEFDAGAAAQVVADELDQRPRKRFAFATPTEELAQLLWQ